LNERSAIQEFEQDHNARVIAIAKLGNLIEFLSADATQTENLERVAAYRDKFGVSQE